MMDDRAREVVDKYATLISPLIRNTIAAAISAYGDEREREALEEAVKEAKAIQQRELAYRNDQHHHEIAWTYNDIGQRTAEEIADAIRSLIKESK